MIPRIRIGIDVGGTFTDFVLVDEGRDLIYTGKRLTTPDDPGDAIVAGLERILAEAGVAIAAVHSIVHGTTLVANTLIEGTGATVGLVTTRGFRDALEIGREIRYDLYDLFQTRPTPLVPRFLRLEVDERVSADGAVLRPLHTDEVRRVARDLTAAKVDAVAVSFVHAYRNAAHEQLAARILGEELPGIPISVSSDVAPEIREFERTSTTCANAYVQPRMQHYLARLEARLAALGLRSPLHIMLSGGGITTVRAAREYPVRLVESGPAAGAMAAAYYGQLARTPSMISFDMGGTTAKMCLIERGWPERVHELEAGRVRRFRKGSGHPLKVPVVEMIEIGAGGGSIARVDAMGLLKVGPHSAGAEPGPVCYGRGGALPTVTDADLLLGYLSPDYFLGGEMRLDRAAVERAVDEHVAQPLGLSVHDAAVGIHTVVNENMAAATRMHVAEKGRDPRRYTLVAFGGAGPVHAWALARLLKIPRIVCPFGAGVTSALGMLVAAPAIDLTRSYVARLRSVDWARVEDLYAAMEREARALLAETGADPSEISIRRAADMRYAGQGFEITVRLPDGALDAPRAPEVETAFHETYRERFGRAILDVAVEALSWRLSASAPVPNVTIKFGGQPTEADDAPKGTRPVWFPETGVAPCPVLSRYGLRPGTERTGPLVVEERESTTIVGPGGRVTVDAHLNLIVELP